LSWLVTGLLLLVAVRAGRGHSGPFRCRERLRRGQATVHPFAYSLAIRLDRNHASRRYGSGPGHGVRDGDERVRSASSRRIACAMALARPAPPGSRKPIGRERRRDPGHVGVEDYLLQGSEWPVITARQIIFG